MSHTPCVTWTGAIDADGYGRVQHSGKWRGAHRVAWERSNGPIAEGLVIDHLCRNRACVNPDHMEAVTSAENTRRGFGPAAINARKTECVHGHPLSGGNLVVGPTGRRWCRECGRVRWRAYRNKHIEAGTWARS